MVTTTRIQAQVAQLQQFDTAIANFMTKYANQLPGESTFFDTTGVPASELNDKRINADNTGYPEFSGEVRYVWQHLKDGVSLFSEYTFDTTTLCGGECDFKGPTLNMPPSKISDTGVMVAYDDGGYLGGSRNYYAVAKFEQSANLEESAGATKCIDIAALDKKFGDDGIPDTGNVRAVNCGNTKYTALNTESNFVVNILTDSNLDSN